MLYKSLKPLLGIFIPLLGMLLVACGGKKENTAAASAPAVKLPVDVTIAKEQALDQDEVVVGTMMPNREVAIVSELAQKIKLVSFKDGSYVKAEEVLYVLNDADIKARLNQIAAELELAKVTKERLYNLLQTETVKQQEYDEALMRFRTLEAQQDLLRVEQAKTIIKAPFAGRIGISKVQVGAYVSPGIPLVTLEDQGNIKINFSIPERYLPLVQTGAKVQFTTELSDKQHTATITATEPGLDATGRSLLVQAVTTNAGGKFRAGMSTKIYFQTTGKGAQGVELPTEALIPGEKGYNVFVIKGGVAKPVPVTIGNRTEAYAVITSGIASGDSIIISNTLRLGDGTPVQAIVNN